MSRWIYQISVQSDDDFHAFFEKKNFLWPLPVRVLSQVGNNDAVSECNLMSIDGGDCEFDDL